ncbi:hypothetical protein DV735_g4664, partial [Chaetothyriales sp. CBS 134920]
MAIPREKASDGTGASVDATTSKVGFLHLPPEIRNKIYAQIVPSSRVLISGNHPQKEVEQYKKKHGTQRAPKFRYRLSSLVLSNVDPREVAAAAAFLRVCRVVRSEIHSLLYSSTSFCFTTVKPINKFLNVLPEDAKRHINQLEISYSAYGEPVWTKDEYWKIKSDWKWTMVCARIEKELPSLRSVNLSLQVSDWPLQLALNNSCFEPLVILKGSSGLESARIQLSHHRFHPKRCAEVAKGLEDMMMTIEGREQRDIEGASIKAALQTEEREARNRQRRAPRARRVLVITNIPAQASRSTKTYYRTTGLERFSRITD